MAKDRSKARRRARPGWGVLLSGAGAALCALFASILGFGVDWTMLCLALVVLMPLLFASDLFAMAVLARSARKGDPDADPGSRIAPLASLAAVHLASAGLAVLLLAVPASSVWAEGLTLDELRVLLVAAASYGFFRSLGVPWAVASALTPQRRAEDAEGVPEGAGAASAPVREAPAPEADSAAGEADGEFALEAVPEEAGAARAGKPSR